MILKLCGIDTFRMNGLDGINLELSRAYIIVSNRLGHWERFPPISEIVTHPAKFKSPFLSDQFELRTEWRMEDILYCTIPKGRKQAVIALPQFLKIPLKQGIDVRSLQWFPHFRYSALVP